MWVGGTGVGTCSASGRRASQVRSGVSFALGDMTPGTRVSPEEHRPSGFVLERGVRHHARGSQPDELEEPSRHALDEQGGMQDCHVPYAPCRSSSSATDYCAPTSYLPPLHPPASLHAFPAHPWITLCTLGSQRALRIKDKSGSWIARIQGIKDRILQRRLSARKESRGLLVGNQDSRGSGKNDPDEDIDQPATGYSSFSQLFCHASPPAELNAWTATLKKVERKS